MKNFYAFRNQDSPDVAHLDIYDEIGFWGTTAKDFMATLKTIKAKTIVVSINSPGGSVMDGFAIYNRLRSHGAKIEVSVDGIAASIASVIAMAGDVIRMPQNSFMFIHQPLVGAVGNAEDLRKMAEDLDKVAVNIQNIYAVRSGADVKAIQKMMQEETMLTAQEAMDMGFCDEILPEMKAAARYNAADYFDGATVDRIKAALPVEKAPSSIPAGGQDNNHNLGEAMDPKEIKALQDKVAALEGENVTLKSSATEAQNTARQEATNKAKTDETARKSAIKAIADKYNKDGDLNAITIAALSGDITPEAFKDQVLEAVNGRPAKAAIKTGQGASDDFGTRYEACKTDAERQALVRENRAEARAYLRNLNAKK